MKKVILGLVLALIPSMALAQPVYTRNEAGTTRLTADGQISNTVSVDRALRMLVNIGSGTSNLTILPISNSAGLNGLFTANNGYSFIGADTIEAASTTTVLNLTAHVARVGDLIVPTAGTAANIDVAIPVCAVSTNSVTLCTPLPATPSTDAIVISRPKPIAIGNADTPWSLEDMAPLAMALRRDTLVTTSNVNGGYTPLVASSQGVLRVSVINNGQIDAGGLLKGEDSVAGTGDAGVVGLFQAESAITQAVSATNDYGVPKIDLGGRVVTIPAPSGQMVAGCNAAVTTAATGTIIAGVPSQFTFITSLSCTNTGAAATRVILEDGAGNDLANVILPATTGFASVSFPSPVRTSVVNSAIQANVITTGSSTICCASGYTGVI